MKKFEGLIVVLVAIVVAGLPAYAAKKPQPAIEYRSIDGTNNNMANPTWGSANTRLLRKAGVGYADGIEAPAGPLRQSARVISNILCAQNQSILNRAKASDFFWQWGQFMDHDMDLTLGGSPPEPFNIAVPLGDPFFDPNLEGNQCIELNRSSYQGGDSLGNPRQQITINLDYSARTGRC